MCGIQYASFCQQGPAHEAVVSRTVSSPSLPMYQWVSGRFVPVISSCNNLFLFQPSGKQFAKYLSNPHISERRDMMRKTLLTCSRYKSTRVKFGSAK